MEARNLKESISVHTDNRGLRETISRYINDKLIVPEKNTVNLMLLSFIEYSKLPKMLDPLRKVIYKKSDVNTKKIG